MRRLSVVLAVALWLLSATYAAAADYVVQPGDTLSAIARANGTTVAELAEASGIANPNYIYPGQVVVVPDAAEDIPSVADVEVARALPSSRGGGRTFAAAPEELQDAIATYFPEEEWEKAARVSQCESRWDPYARLVTRLEDSRGYFQINTYSHPGLGNLYDADINTRAAYNIWARRGWYADWRICAYH